MLKNLPEINKINKEELIRLNLDEKIEWSRKIINKAFESYKKLILTWTGGKDSTLMLWLVRNFCLENNYKIPKVIFINEGDIFEEILEFINQVKESWNLDLVEIKNEDVLKQVRKVGDVVKVSKLNERNRNELKKIGFKGEEFVFEPESLIGCHLMKTVPLKEYIEKNNIEGVFVAIRWDEQEARSEETFFSPRKDPDHIRIHPILHFTEKDVWTAIKRYNIPVNKLYSEGYRSLGAKSTTKKLSDKPAWEQDFDQIPERAGRYQDKEEIMKRLRDLGYM